MTDQQRPVRVITSFSADGYGQYGEKFLQTFEEFWPEDVGLTVYHEYQSDELKEIAARHSGRFAWRRLFDVPGWTAFFSAISQFPVLCGDVGSGYTIHTDARMVRKVFMEADAVKSHALEQARVIWLDADTITHAPVGMDFIGRVLPDDVAVSYLGRKGVAYTESGFLGYNTRHPLCQPFMELYLQYFTTGTFLTGSYFHDCEGFDRVRDGVEAEHPGMFLDLGAGVPLNDAMHVFINSPLGEVMDHMKGPRKEAGRSSKADLTAPRAEAHWA